MAGRLQPWKRQHLLIEAVAALRRRGRSVHGLVVGGDAYRLSPAYAESLPRLAAKLVVEAKHPRDESGARTSRSRGRTRR